MQPAELARGRLFLVARLLAGGGEQQAETDIGQALKARTPEPPASPAGPAPAPAEPAPAVDPMQWWGALTQQFTQLAAQAMKEGPVEAARNAAGQFAQAAARAPKAPAPAPGKPAAGAPKGRRPAARAPARAPRSKQT